MSFGPPSIVLCLYSQPPRPAASTAWVTGAVSTALALASFALSSAGHERIVGTTGECVLTGICQGAGFAVASLGTALAGVLVGLLGSALGKSTRLFSALGGALNVAFLAVFYSLWI